MFSIPSMKLKLLNAFALAVVIAVNGLANALPLNGQTTGSISDSLNVLFTPAGYVFSIWGVIYLLMILWVLRAFFAKPTEEHIYAGIGYTFILSCVFNVLWLFLFHYEIFYGTMAAILGLWLSLGIIYMKIKTSPRRGLLLVPISVYFGWVTVASITNIGVVLTANGVRGWIIDGSWWTALAIAAASAAVILFYRKTGDILYTLVFIWAFAGIFVQRWQEVDLVAWTAAAAALVLFVQLFFRPKRKFTYL
jgi:hypothetical protein